MRRENKTGRDFKAEMAEIMNNWNPTSGPVRLNEELRRVILDMYARQSEISLATVRADGWPQANVVDFWNSGLIMYFQSYEGASKIKNMEMDSRVSLTLTPPFDNFGEMVALSMAARAERVTNRTEIGDLYHLFLDRVPHMKEFARYDGDTAYPGPGMGVYRLRPEMGCVINFNKGYGHWDYVRFDSENFSEWETLSRKWAGEEA